MSGGQVAGDANEAGEVYPDQSLYPANSVPSLVRRINKALRRADQIQHAEGHGEIDWFVPMVADAEAGFGGNLNAFELMKDMINAGAAAVHFGAQHKLAGGGVGADVVDVPTILIARTDANSARLITSDVDPRDHEFLSRERTFEGFYPYAGGIDAAISRGLSFARYADMLWCETAHPDLEEAKHFAEAIHAKYPGKLLASNCSPSFT